ncbi:MAG TPA: hypothetical protein VHF89_10445 [Solirubrobacteraceae bacterium]|nr:hypothetical protein [Solirubrobacteraceae bacterium]
MSARRAAPWAALALVLLAAAVLLMWAGRDTTFFYDDWPYVLDRGPWTLDAFLEPHNEHLQAVSVLIYKVLFETVGLHHYGVYRLVLVVLNLLTAALLFAYARRRVGTAPALGLAACLVVMAPSWYNLVYAFQVNFVGAMAAGVGALLAFDRGTRRGDALGSALLCVAIASSSVGFPFLAGAAAEVLLRGDRWRRIWVVAVPAALYGVWMLAYGDGRSARAANLDAIPEYVRDGYDDSVAAITGLTLELAVPVAVALVLLVGWALGDRQARSPRLVALVVMPLSLWVLTALGRADMGVEADANRYLYASGLLVALVAVEAARRYAPTGRLAVVVGVLLGFGALHNASQVEGGGNTLRAWSGSGKDAATALDLARGKVPPWYADADPTQGFIEARRYYAAVDRYGSSPGFTLEELLRAPEERRAGTDEKLLRVLQFGVGPVAAGERVGAAPPPVDGTGGASALVERRGCVRFVPAEPDAFLEVRVPPRGMFVSAGESPVELRLRRFATEWPEKAYQTIVAGSAGGLAIARDRAPQPWRAQLRGAATFEACSFG